MTDWQTPADLPSLADGELHLWRTPVLDDDAQLAALYASLSSDERKKADRFRHATVRRTSIVARGLLRSLLGAYLAAPPHALQFRYNAYGKPALTFGDAAAIQFNVTHSGDWIVAAFTRTAAVGVDIERHRPLDDLFRLARRFFSPTESAALSELPESAQSAAFFRCWARKEAYIKAVGEGVFAGLDRFDVSLRPEEPPRVLHGHRSDFDVAAWTMRDFTVADSYSGAVLVQMASCAMRCWEWRPA